MDNKEPKIFLSYAHEDIGMAKKIYNDHRFSWQTLPPKIYVVAMPSKNKFLLPSQSILLF